MFDRIGSIVCACVVAAMAASVMAGQSATGSQTHVGAALTPDPFAKGIPMDAPEFMANGYTPTAAQALAQAKSFTYIVAPTVNMYKSYIAQMHQVNPALKVLYYVNGTFAFPSELGSIPSTWYQLDASGKKIQSKGFGNYLMNPAGAPWLTEREQKCAQGISNGGVDGCFIDTMGPSPVTPGYVSSMPYNPSTKANWTPAQWLAQTARNGTAIKAFIGSKLLFVNGLQNGKSYFDPAAPTSQILQGVDGALVELFVRPPDACITCFHKASQWQQDVDMLADTTRRGKTVLTVTKVWVPGTTAQLYQWGVYALATFLLGYTSNEYFHFRTDHGPSIVYGALSADVGAPLASYYATNGYFRRDFSAGVVLANPNSASFTINLGASYRLLTGVVVTTVTLGPDSGLVLTKV